MTLLDWVVSYVLDTFFWLWVVRWGGAESIVGVLSSVPLVSMLVPRRSVEAIKLIGWVILIVTRFWFLVGLFFPGARFRPSPVRLGVGI